MDRTSADGWTDIGGGKHGYRDENLLAGIDGTALIAADRNAIQEELLAVIEAAGLTPSDADLAQLLAAIRVLGRAGSGLFGTDTGTANAMVLTLSPVPAALTAGMLLRVKKSASANTGAVTLNVNSLGASSVTRPDGTALAAKELPANAWMQLLWSGTAWVLMSVAAAPRQGLAGTTTLNFLPTSGGAQTRTLSFTPGCDGYILAVGALNFAGAQPVTITSDVKLNGTTISLDSTVLPMSNPGTASVTGGTAYTLSHVVTAGSSGGAFANATMWLSYIFVPVM